VLFAAMFDEESGITTTLSDMETRLVPVIDYYLSNRDIFTEIFGEKAAEKYFEADCECDEDLSETEDDVPEEISEDEEFANKVVDVLYGLLDAASATSENEAYEVIMLAPNYSDKLEMACDEAYLRCKAAKKDYIDLDTLIYCILQNKESSAYKFLLGLLDSIDININDFINSLKVTGNICDLNESETRVVTIPTSLESCVENFNLKYAKGEECTILGRDKEIFKAFNVFSKKTKRNCVLIGQPGVGKTAIIEAITQAIVNETCPKEFIGYTVLSLDINSMIAGTKYRGEFETKVAVLKTFLQSTSKVILFVDEMHQMLGAGGTSEGAVDLSGSLKPILSRDDVVFVGATTVNEYNQIL